MSFGLDLLGKSRLMKVISPKHILESVIWPNIIGPKTIKARVIWPKVILLKFLYLKLFKKMSFGQMSLGLKS